MKFEKILEGFGGPGRVQYFLMIVAFFGFAVNNMQTYVQMFMQGDDNYRCFVPSCDNSSSKYNEQWLNFTTPMVYDKKIDGKLVCDKKYFIELSMTIYLAGFLCGVFVFGLISDRISAPCETHSHPYSSKFDQEGLAQVQHLVTEVCVANSRVIVTASTFGSEFGSFLLVGIAYFFRNWKELQIAVTIFSSLFLFCFCFLPESPRWLFMKGRNEEAKQTLKKIFQVHKKEQSIKFFNHIDKVKIEGFSENKLNFIGVLKISSLRKRLLINGFIWICAGLISYGIALGAKNMSGSIYVNYTFITVGKTVGCLICTLCVKYIKRRISSSICFFCLAFFCLTLALIPEDLVLLAQVLTMIATGFINAAFNLIYIYTVELFPTQIRSSALGFGSMLSQIGGMVALFVNNSIYVWRPLPPIIFSVTGFLAAAMILLLPETINKPLPSVQDITRKKGQLINTSNTDTDSEYSIRL
ncbi:Solute carrier family 22 member 5 [Nymphon striatum]|nr:Solute carrier family 22 member 5 [Nymphon striatum]